MATLTLRNVKNAPLTNAEVDANFTNLNTELIALGANPIFSGDVTIDGDLTVQGNSTLLSAQNLAVSDNMIFLNVAAAASVTGASGDGSNVVYIADNNYVNGMKVTVTGMSPNTFNVVEATITSVSANTFTIASAVTDSFSSGGSAAAKTSINPDLGWAGGYDDGTFAHAGIFRDASDSGKFKIYDGYTPDPNATTAIDTTHGSFSLASLEAGNFIGNGSQLTNVVATTLGGSTKEDLEGNALALAIALG